MTSPEDSGLLLAIQEEELPEVVGSSERLDEPDDSAIIASFTKTQEFFLERILVRATTEMAQVQATAFRQQQQEIQHLRHAMNNMQYKQDNLPIKLPAMMETPRVPRPQDLEYQNLLDTTKRLKEKKEEREQRNRKTWSTPGSHPVETPNNDMALTMQTFLANMGSLLKNNNKNCDSVTELPRFQGMDTQWPKWHQLLRAYLQAKGWLTTFDHPIGIGTALNPTPRFGTDINEEIYQKLHSKCWDGTASPTSEWLPNSMAMVLGRLKERYNKQSPQQLESYKKLAKSHRHISGTSIPIHIDQFEAILSYMPECGYIPTASDRFELQFYMLVPVIPELMFGRLTNQKVPMHHQHVTDIMRWRRWRGRGGGWVAELAHTWPCPLSLLPSVKMSNYWNSKGFVLQQSSSVTRK